PLAPPSLRSSPTRRSSDLEAPPCQLPHAHNPRPAPAVAHLQPHDGGRGDKADGLGGQARPRRTPDAVGRQAPCAGDEEQVAGDIDRKSTRLNSSHVKISYA